MSAEHNNVSLLSNITIIYMFLNNDSLYNGKVIKPKISKKRFLLINWIKKLILFFTLLKPIVFAWRFYMSSITQIVVTIATWHWRYPVFCRRREFFFSLINDLHFLEISGVSILVSFSVSRDIPDVRSAKSVALIVQNYRSKSLYIMSIYNVYLNTPEIAEVSHPVYWLFLYGLFMSHAHNPPPRVVDSRPPFQSPRSVRMFCIARRSVAEFSYQWRWTFVVFSRLQKNRLIVSKFPKFEISKCGYDAIKWWDTKFCTSFQNDLEQSEAI